MTESRSDKQRDVERVVTYVKNAERVAVLLEVDGEPTVLEPGRSLEITHAWEVPSRGTNAREEDDELPLDPDAIRIQFNEWWDSWNTSGLAVIDKEVAFEAFDAAAHLYKEEDIARSSSSNVPFDPSTQMMLAGSQAVTGITPVGAELCWKAMHRAAAVEAEQEAAERSVAPSHDAGTAEALLREVYDDLLTATETWRDSSAGPSTVSGDPRELQEISPETWAKLCAFYAKENPEGPAPCHTGQCEREQIGQNKCMAGQCANKNGAWGFR